MTSEASQLLKVLGSATPRIQGALPGSAEGAVAGPSVPGRAFEELLSKARAGELSSNRMVEVDEHAGVELTAEQIAVLSVAADKAEAQGLRHALVILDDVQVMLDVGMRRVTGRASLNPVDGQPMILPGIDGVINLSSRLRSEEPPARVGPPAVGAAGPSLTKLLEAVGGRPAA